MQMQKISLKNKVRHNEDEYLPIPIQFFFWNQTSLFIKQKFGNLTEAHALNFERVLVQNILHGLSLGLSDAISSISRWKLVRSSFPYIVHASFASLSYKRYQLQSMKLGKADTKLLYILNWLLIDAASECIVKLQNEDLNPSRNKVENENLKAFTGNLNDTSHENIEQYLNEISNDESFLYPITMIQLFINLFIPIIKSIDEKDLDNLILNNGSKIWLPLWNHKQPNIDIFMPSVKQQQINNIESQMDKQQCSKKNDESSNKTGVKTLVAESDRHELNKSYSIKRTLKKSTSMSKSNSYVENMNKWLHEKTHCSEISLDKMNYDIKSNNDSKKDRFPYILSENEFYKNENTYDQSLRLSNLLITTVGDDAIYDEEFHSNTAPLVHMSSICSIVDTTLHRTSPVKESLPTLNESNKPAILIRSVNQITNETQNQSSTALRNLSRFATNFDIALIRCIFNSKWHLDGYLWSLEYLHNRVLHIIDEMLKCQEDSMKLGKKSSSFTSLESDSLCKKRQLFNRNCDKFNRNNETIAAMKKLNKNIKYIDEDFAKTEKKMLGPLQTDFFRSRNSNSSHITVIKRSTSDFNIYYEDHNTNNETFISSELTNRDGSINLGVVLKSLLAITYKENSTKICEITLSILEILLNANCFISKETEIKDSKNRNLSKQFYLLLIKKEKKMNENFSLAINVSFRIIKWLSCSNCRQNTRTFANEQLRNRVKIVLSKLHRINSKFFNQCLKHFVEDNELENIFQTLHALFTFCSDPGPNTFNRNVNKLINQGVNDQYEKIIVNSKIEKSLNSLIVCAVLKPILRRTVQMGKTLMNHENIHLLTELRSFFSFLRESHKDAFQRVIFSPLLDPIMKFKKQQEECRKKKTRAHTFFQKDELRLNKSVDYLNLRHDRMLELNQAISIDYDLLVDNLNFYRILLEFSAPALVPNTAFIGALHELESPILSKICIVSETANLIGQFSKNMLSDSLKLNMTNLRTAGSLPNKAMPNSFRRNKAYHIAISDVLYAWGEILGMNLEKVLTGGTLLSQNNFSLLTLINEVFSKTDDRNFQFDFQIITCTLLHEISSFIREVFPQILKKTKSLNNNVIRENKHIGSVFSNESSSISILNESTLYPDLHQNNLQYPSEQDAFTNNESLNNIENETTKHISFTFREDSLINYNQHTNDFEGNINEIAPTNQSIKVPNIKFTGQLKRSSLKQTKKASVKYKIDRATRLTRRKPSHSFQVSELREQDLSANNANQQSDNESSFNIQNISNNNIPSETLNENNDEILDFNKTFPWIKAILKLMEKFNFNCDHINCESNCYYQCSLRSGCLMETCFRLYDYNHVLNKDMTKQKDANIVFVLNNKKYKENERKISIVSSNSQNIAFINHFLNNNTFFHGQLRQNVDILQKPEIDEVSHFLKYQIQNFIYAPLELLCKCAIMIQDEYFVSIIQIAWNLLLESDLEISSCAVTLFLIAGIKQPSLVEQFLRKEFKSHYSLDRYKAILKFEILWKLRYHIWPHLETNATYLLKISPPCIEFILPSPLVGQTLAYVSDPPWLPKPKKSMEEVAVNQEEIRAVVTTSKSRKKYQQEVLIKALQAEEKTKRTARETFNITATSYLSSASFEPLLFQNRDEQNDSNDEIGENTSNITDIMQSQAVFPTSIASVVLCLIDLLHDDKLGIDFHPISEFSEKVIRGCLIDDPALFLRYFFEKITHKEKKEKVLQYTRRLLNMHLKLPVQAAHICFNYLLGVVMYYTRSPSDGSQDSVSSIMTLLWQLVSDVNGIIFKDLKQLLKKEQCDPSILITANVPSAKKLIIHGPDLSQIPTQLPISEDTRFSFVMQETFDFFSIPESKREKFFLFDVKSSQIQLPDTYVRDFYFFRRNYYPQLTIVSIDNIEAVKLLEKTAFGLKVLEQSKVLFFQKILDNSPPNQLHAISLFLLDELNKTPSFPRKALEADFNLYSRISDRELSTMDMLHKYSWLKLIWSLFSSMDSKTTSLSDITILLNIINGAFVLHCENLNMLRSCLAIYLSVVKRFQQIFTNNGFLLILPSILKVYSNMQTNQLLKRSIECVCAKFYSMHRIPFLLQLFASITQIVDMNNLKINQMEMNKASYLFHILNGLEHDSTDELKIVELSNLFEQSHSRSKNKLQKYITPSKISAFNQNNSVHLNDINISLNNQSNSLNNDCLASASIINNSTLNPPSAILAAAGINTASMLSTGFALGNNTANKTNEIERNNIKPLDFCYSDLVNEKFAFMDAINLCVTVIAYATHANRAFQMLSVLDIIIPQFMEHMQNETEKSESSDTIKREYESIQKISLALKTMINSVELISRNFIGPRAEILNTSYKNANSYSHRSPSILPDEDSMRFFEEKRSKSESDDKKQKNDLHFIRDIILKISSDFIFNCSNRFKETEKLSTSLNLKVIELFDAKTHNKLAEIAQCLLKQSDDTMVINGPGLQNYFQRLFPLTDWAHDTLKGSLSIILRRIDRTFKKIMQRTTIRKNIDWNAGAGILTGLYLLLEKQDTVAQLPFFKTFINSVVLLVQNENTELTSENEITNKSAQIFFKALIKLIGRYISNLREHENLEQLFSIMMGVTDMQSTTLGVSYLVNFLIPILLWSKMNPAKLNSYDLTFAISIILHSAKISSKVVSNLIFNMPKPQVIDALDATFAKFQHFQNKSIRNLKDMISQAAFLGLKVIDCDSTESFELSKIAITIGKISSKIKNIYIWKFFEFLCTYRNPLFLLLRPYIQTIIQSRCFENEDDFKISKEIQAKLDGSVSMNNRSKFKILSELQIELDSIKKDLKGDRSANLTVNSRIRPETSHTKKLEEYKVGNEEKRKKSCKCLDIDSGNFKS